MLHGITFGEIYPRHGIEAFIHVGWNYSDGVFMYLLLSPDLRRSTITSEDDGVFLRVEILFSDSSTSICGDGTESQLASFTLAR